VTDSLHPNEPAAQDAAGAAPSTSVPAGSTASTEPPPSHHIVGDESVTGDWIKLPEEDAPPAVQIAAAAAALADAAEATAEAAPAADGERVSDLIAMIKESADKLASDNTSRGDLKILSRTLRELRYAFKVFTPYRRRRKVSMFGSARTRPDHPAYQQAVAFGRAMAAHGWLVLTGAASGIMEAGHVGAGRENSMGLNIMLPFEQSSNPVIAGDPKLVHMKYFFTRKLMFVKECDAVALLPGGFGTLDEGLEVLTLLQTGKRDMAPVVCLDEPGGSFWQDFHAFVQRQLLAGGMISPEDFALYTVTDDVEVAVAEIMRFFRSYHSMRYVKNKLVLRLTERPSDELLAGINDRFADILTDGRFVLSGPLAGERDEPELAHLHRLVFRFNRRSLGRLRMLIDVLNRGSLEKAAG
jgi:uncharacterized protein (TIGR00730 family)